MTTGELWITNPLFPWIMIVLALWVTCSTIVMARSWAKIKELEQKSQNTTCKCDKKQPPSA